MWTHAIHNCVPVRIIHARDLSNSSITLTSKDHTRLFSRFRLVSNKIRPACVAPHVIETEKKKSYQVPTTDSQIPTKKMKYFNEKSKVTILTYMHMMSYIIHMIYEYEYFRSAPPPVTKSSTKDHTASLFCFIQRTTSMYVSYEFALKIPGTRAPDGRGPEAPARPPLRTCLLYTSPSPRD